MPQGYIQVLPDSTGKQVDTSELTRQDNTLVERQRVVLADPDDLADTLSLDSLRQDRQLTEIHALEAIEASIASIDRRQTGRVFLIDRRGGTFGRGAIR